MKFNFNLKVAFATSVLCGLFIFSDGFCKQKIMVAFDADITFGGMGTDNTWQKYATGTQPRQGHQYVSDSILWNKVQVLHYYKNLGYKYFIFDVNCGSPVTFNSSTNQWVYSTSDPSFTTAKAAIEYFGMKMLPSFEFLSHMDGFISQDISLGEFYDPATKTSTFANYVSVAHNGMAPNTITYNALAYVGNYPTITNSHADQIFNGLLQVILSNWGSTSLGGSCPDYILMNHDENGAYTAILVGQGRSQTLLTNGLTVSDLVAREIAWRYKTVQDVFLSKRGSKQIPVMVYGDSYVPADNGQVYGLCGDVNTGVGGVLYKIKNDSYINNTTNFSYSNIANNIIVVPWDYGYVDGMYYNNNFSYAPLNSYDCRINKLQQIAYLSNMGYKYLPLSGDWAGDLVGNSGPARLQWYLQTTYEWVRAAQMFPANCIGYGQASWIYRWNYVSNDYKENLNYFSDINNKPNSITNGYNGAVLAYCLMTNSNSNYVTRHSYVPSFYNNCNYIHSRNSISWQQGIDYSSFPVRTTLAKKTWILN
jgi:hypothetical protein